MRRSIAILTLPIVCVVCASAGTRAQSPSVGTPWDIRASAASYIFPDADNYLQPTVAIDHGALHLEGRYNYEDQRSVSGFIGWNFEFGTTIALHLTPMFGAVGGNTNGIVPALELNLVWRRLEVYSEGEYVIDVGHPRNRFLYNWSEVSVWATEWFRAGLVTQRTRAHGAPRDIQRGPLVGVTVLKVEPVFYFFNPGSDDHFFVAAINIEF